MALLSKVNRERDATLILVTHNLALAVGAEQIVQIAEGKIRP
jgi:predicted ABC-type transport system involved in lysophospholipase L1 biosynthesis ATPase subunit